MSTTLLQGDERLPRYQRLADQLRHKVLEGDWRPGDRVPSENELSEEFSIAPGTARQALAQLVNEGILERFHGKGTFVRSPSFDRSLFRFFRFQSDAQEIVIPESRILSIGRSHAPDHVARHLNIARNADAIAISRLRLLDAQPVLIEEIWLPASIFEPLLELDPDDMGPLLYPIYDVKCGALIAQAEEVLTVEAASAETAGILRLDAGAPIIVIDRLAKAFDDAPLEWRRSRGRADQFRYHTEIR